MVQTAIVDSPDGILVGDHVSASPYRIEAIGPSDTLAAGLSFPGGCSRACVSRAPTGIVIERDYCRDPGS